MKIGFVVGGLSEDSANRVLATAAASLIGDDAVVVDGVDLPNYNHELENDVPEAVVAWRDTIQDLDGIVFVTPEYNALPPGSVKNAIDWASRPYGAAVIGGKPVGVLGASISSNGAVWAQEAVLKAAGIAGAATFDRSPVPVGPAPEVLGTDGITDADLEAQVREYLDAFVAQIADPVA